VGGRRCGPGTEQSAESRCDACPRGKALCTVPTHTRISAATSKETHLGRSCSCSPACPRAPQSLMPIANSTHRTPPSPHPPRAHAVRARTPSIAAHAGISSICRNAALPLYSPRPRAATDTAVLEMGHNNSENAISLQGARGPVGDRERGGPEGVKPSALSRSTDPEHAGAGRGALCLDRCVPAEALCLS